MRPRSGLKARDVIAWGEALRAEPQVKNLSKTIAGLKGRDEFRPHRPGRSWGDGPGPPLALLASAQACVSRSRGWTLFRLSRSDRVTVAVGFSPRKRGKVGRVAERRMSEPGGGSCVATRRGVSGALFRGLKPTAPVRASLRDVGMTTSSNESTVCDGCIVDCED